MPHGHGAREDARRGPKIGGRTRQGSKIGACVALARGVSLRSVNTGDCLRTRTSKRPTKTYSDKITGTLLRDSTAQPMLDWIDDYARPDMKAQLIQFSTVVVGKTHNPSILNPDFLAANEIVPNAWGWEVAETLTTPPLAVVRYTNGIAVTVEFGKLQVTNVNVGEDQTMSKAAEIATSYVRTLPHVRYTAAGINFQSIVAIDSPETFLKERFVTSGPWNSEERRLSAAGLRLVYALGDEGRVTLSLDAGEAQSSDDKAKTRVVIVNGNFHRECREHPDHETVAKHLTNVDDDWAVYCDLLTKAILE